MNNQDKVEQFLIKVENQIHTENNACDIKDELLDHIESLKADYIESGLSEEEATSKALRQMGDPNEIGYAFTDYEGMKKRQLIIRFFKLSGIVMLLISFLPAIIQVQDGKVLFSFSEYASMLPSLMNLVFIFYTGSLLVGYSMKFLEIDTRPFAIIWPVKERFKWEYILLLVFFLPIVVVMFLIYFFEEGISGHTILALWPILTISYSVFAYFYKERFRIPKVVLVEEGFILKGRFLSWTSIGSYNWTKDFLAKDKSHYKLVLNMFQNNGSQMGYRKTISVHKRQYAYIHQFIKEKIS